MSKALYRIKLHSEVLSQDSKQFDAKTKHKIKKKCIDFLTWQPDQAGDSLRGELHPYRKLKIFDDYRIIYRVDIKTKIVYILAIGIRRNEEVYQEAIRRLKKL